MQLEMWVVVARTFSYSPRLLYPAASLFYFLGWWEGTTSDAHLISPLFKSAQTVSWITLPISGVNNVIHLAWGKSQGPTCMCRNKGVEGMAGVVRHLVGKEQIPGFLVKRDWVHAPEVCFKKQTGCSLSMPPTLLSLWVEEVWGIAMGRECRKHSFAEKKKQNLMSLPKFSSSFSLPP